MCDNKFGQKLRLLLPEKAGSKNPGIKNKMERGIIKFILVTRD